ncbi:uncharacterized protein AMSG_00743 [Thecamonas trahens ATCC 50062]|uniref:VHS domain-containing protein n=1 Tax=Thecamonas trahens ATCC 50062 TaxID=461836 RepID=A0A0L0DH00_THETB|nr:hypothetical protein AMSG_00743 [Thecamonas trahens ATCC 50062]KNC50583.1 hypothetical protein AMSG_00743 [Thecamonas trahens ATCC 50062]|eukprot:XP_013762472.1 hypothetical protein AMSG_00743 [Thecamonas trahens ATCC 50062]
MDVATRHRIHDLVKGVANSGRPVVEPKVLAELRALGKTVSGVGATVFEAMWKELPRKHAQVRLSMVALTDALFTASKAFRKAVIRELNAFVALVVGSPAEPLPKPAAVAPQLRAAALAAIDRWHAKVPDVAQHLDLAIHYINSRLRLQLPSQIRRAAEAARSAPRPRLARPPSRTGLPRGALPVSADDRSVRIQRTQVLLRAKFDELVERADAVFDAAASSVEVLANATTLLETAQQARQVVNERKSRTDVSNVELLDRESESRLDPALLEQRYFADQAGAGSDGEYEYEYGSDDEDADDMEDGPSATVSCSSAASTTERAALAHLCTAVRDAALDLRTTSQLEVSRWISVVGKVQLPVGGYERTLQSRFMARLLETKAAMAAALDRAEQVLPDLDQSQEPSFEEVALPQPPPPSQPSAESPSREATARKRGRADDESPAKSGRRRKRRRKRTNLLPLVPQSQTWRKEALAKSRSRDAMLALHKSKAAVDKRRHRDPNRWNTQI